MDEAYNSTLVQPGLKTNNLHARLFLKKEYYRLKAHFIITEWLLRRKDSSHLGLKKQQMRAIHLDNLHRYWQAGVFPINTSHPNQTVPLIKDEYGTLCAMAHIIWKDGARDLINQLHQENNTVRITADTAGALGDWIESSGLTREEARQIQPQYGYECNPVFDICAPKGTGGTMNFSILVVGLAVVFFAFEFFLLRLLNSMTLGRKGLFFGLSSLLSLLIFSTFGILLYMLGDQMTWWS